MSFARDVVRVPAALRSVVRRPDLWLGLAIVAADQAVKALVEARVPLHATIEIIPGLLNLTHVQNTGAAFGLLNAVEFPFKSVLITALALTALVAIGAYASRFGSDTWLAQGGLALILGGAVGNLIDRAGRGYVVDFVDAYWGPYHFWAFNVADAAITVGASLLIVEMLWSGRHVSEAA
jgi:signal peptidase II